MTNIIQHMFDAMQHAPKTCRELQEVKRDMTVNGLLDALDDLERAAATDPALLRDGFNLSLLRQSCKRLQRLVAELEGN